jgi:hypothetical protein
MNISARMCIFDPGTLFHSLAPAFSPDSDKVDQYCYSPLSQPDCIHLLQLLPRKEDLENLQSKLLTALCKFGKLLRIAKSGNEDVTKLLLTEGESTPHSKDGYGQTPLS